MKEQFLKVESYVRSLVGLYRYQLLRQGVVRIR